MISTPIFRAASNIYNSESKGPIHINKMEYVHLRNAIKKIENDALKLVRTYKLTNKELYNKLKGLSIPKLASTLCPQYTNLINEYDTRTLNKNMNNADTQISTVTTTSTVTEKINKISNGIEFVENIIDRLGDHESVEQLSQITNLLGDYKASLQIDVTNVSTPSQTQQTETNTIEQETTSKTSEAPATLKSFTFNTSNPRINSYIRNQLLKLDPNITIIDTLADFSIIDILTVIPGVYVYKIATYLNDREIWFSSTPVSNGDSFFFDESDYLPPSLKAFKLHNRSITAFENTALQELNNISLDDSQQWIKTAEAIHERISERILKRYKILAKFVIDNKLDKAENLIPGCSPETRRNVNYWIKKLNSKSN